MTAVRVESPPAGRLWPLVEALEHWGGISRPTVLRAEKAGQLRLTRVGRRVFVADTEVRRIATFGLPSCNVQTAR